jgi:hypothetical protein
LDLSSGFISLLTIWQNKLKKLKIKFSHLYLILTEFSIPKKKHFQVKYEQTHFGEDALNRNRYEVKIHPVNIFKKF